jgi:predicted anti-sigma-YlaC factor YlaD
MYCEQYQERISELLDTELTPEGEAEVYGHLAGCSLCRDFFRSCLYMKEAVQSIPYYDVLKDRSEQKTERIKSFIRVPLPAAAIFLILLITGLIGTSLHFFRSGETAVTEPQRIIYIYEHPEIEVRLMTDME